VVTETGRSRAPTWKNEVTLRSVEMFTEYEPGSYAAFISSYIEPASLAFQGTNVKRPERTAVRNTDA
jgi:hypothetical protein